MGRHLVVAVLLLVTSRTAFAGSDPPQGGLLMIASEGAAPSGGASPLPLKHTAVRASLSGPQSRVTVIQIFTNPFSTPIEAVYIFPLPHQAAVSDLTIKIGPRVVKGIVKRRDEARSMYEAARKQGKTAALLEQQRPNVFTQSVANILPGHEIQVEITYDEVLKYEDGTYEFVYPMVVGPRYIPAGVTDGKKVNPPVLPPGTLNPHEVSLDLSIDAGVPITKLESPSHQIIVAPFTALTQPTSGTVKVTLSPNDVVPNKDFVLRWKVATTKPQIAVIDHRSAKGGFFMLFFQPPATAAPEAITPKELIFVLDTSGSMSGEPIAITKRAMRHALQNLNAHDTFQILRFNEGVSGMSRLPLPATPEAIRAGISYVNGLDASGGTEMVSPLRAALAYPATGRLRIVVLMTDGLVGNEAEIFKMIEEDLGPDGRIFSFGVGSSTNRLLLDGVAEAGRGAAQYIALEEDPLPQVDTFYDRVRSPVLTHISLDWGGLPVEDMSPGRIPDLFLGQPVVLVGRYTRGAKGSVKVRGKVAGKPVEWSIPVELHDDLPDNASLAQLWARRKIHELSRREAENEKPITELALRFGIASSFTSFIVVDEQVVNEGGVMKTIQVPVEMPAGVSYESTVGDAGEEDEGYYAGSPTRSYGESLQSIPGVYISGYDGRGRLFFRAGAGVGTSFRPDDVSPDLMLTVGLGHGINRWVSLGLDVDLSLSLGDDPRHTILAFLFRTTVLPFGGLEVSLGAGAGIDLGKSAGLTLSPTVGYRWGRLGLRLRYDLLVTEDDPAHSLRVEANVSF
jgi:Ca-activated chloride channel homolog